MNVKLFFYFGDTQLYWIVFLICSILVSLILGIVHFAHRYHSFAPPGPPTPHNAGSMRLHDDLTQRSGAEAHAHDSTTLPLQRVDPTRHPAAMEPHSGGSMMMDPHGAGSMGMDPPLVNNVSVGDVHLAAWVDFFYGYVFTSKQHTAATVGTSEWVGGYDLKSINGAERYSYGAYVHYTCLSRLLVLGL